jgi:catechol 2,3-dioxygenase-like lactoylglutathione lyase family enzyme
MTDHPDVDAPRATFITAEPQPFTTDLQAALAFYTDRLGFEVCFAYGEPPFYAQVVRDSARLNLRLVDRPAFDAAFRVEEPDALATTLIVDDAEALSHEYEVRGIAFHQPLQTEPWGAYLHHRRPGREPPADCR